MVIPRWLDSATCSLMQDIVRVLSAQHAGEIQSIILYGSIARHDERPLDDPHPSDVDLLIILQDEKQVVDKEAMHATMSQSFSRHLDAPREVNVLFAQHAMCDWDAMFVANVLRDGIALYGTLPRPDHVQGVSPDLAPLIADIPAVLQRSEQAMHDWLAQSGLALINS